MRNLLVRRVEIAKRGKNHGGEGSLLHSPWIGAGGKYVTL
jgi:hypothetical protein